MEHSKLLILKVFLRSAATGNEPGPPRSSQQPNRHPHFPFLCLWGLRVGVFPGVSLLSRRRLSGLPVDLAVGFGPGLIAMIALLVVLEVAIFVFWLQVSSVSRFLGGVGMRVGVLLYRPFLYCRS